MEPTASDPSGPEPDTESALLSSAQKSANRRANHTVGTMPPSSSATYCHARDEGIWNTAKALMESSRRFGRAGSWQHSLCSPKGVLVETFLDRVARGDALREQRLVNHASRHMFGSIGLLSSSTLASERFRCCPTVLPPVKPTCALTLVSMPELRSPTPRPQWSAQFLHTSSGCCCWSASSVRCQSGCHELLDTLGRHRAACTWSGRFKKRASLTERVLARVCREAGGRAA